MKSESLLKIAGGFSFFFFLFHVPFYWLFNWDESLASLNVNDWAIVMCFNVICIGLLFFMSYVSFFCAKDVMDTHLGRSFSAFAAGFYYFRIAAEFIFFDEPDMVVSSIVIVLCLIPALLYSMPFFQQNRVGEKR